MATSESTPLLRGENGDSNTAVQDNDVEAPASRCENASIQGPNELKIASIAHLNNAVDAFIAGVGGIIIGIYAASQPYWLDWNIREMIQSSIPIGIITALWGVSNFILYRYRRRFLGPPILGLILHGVLFLIQIRLFFGALDTLMRETQGTPNCRRWDAPDLPLDPECVEFERRVHAYTAVELIFVLGTIISSLVLLWFYITWSWRQLMSFLYSIPAAQGEGGGYGIRIPTGGISVEFNIKFWGPRAPPANSESA